MFSIRINEADTCGTQIETFLSEVVVRGRLYADDMGLDLDKVDMVHVWRNYPELNIWVSAYVRAVFEGKNGLDEKRTFFGVLRTAIHTAARFPEVYCTL